MGSKENIRKSVKPSPGKRVSVNQPARPKNGAGAKQTPAAKPKTAGNSKRDKVSVETGQGPESIKPSTAKKKISATSSAVSVVKQRRGKVNPEPVSALNMLKQAAEQAKVLSAPSITEERAEEESAREMDEAYLESLPELPEFQSDRELLEYFGIELFDPERVEAEVKPKQPEPVQKDEHSDGELDPLVAGLTDFSPEVDATSLDLDPISELANLLATAEEAEAVKLNFEALNTLREEDIELKEVEVTRLSDMAFGRIHDAVVNLQEDARAIVSGKSQAFFHDRSSGKIYGEDVYAFVYDLATVESHGSRVIAAGRAVVYAEDGWIGAKDDAFVVAQGYANVQASGDAIVVAEGSSNIEATGRAAVMVNSPLVKVRLLSDDASVILMDLSAQIPEIETLDRQPPKLHQLVSVDSPLGLEKMMEISFREGQRKHRLDWDST